MAAVVVPLAVAAVVVTVAVAVLTVAVVVEVLLVAGKMLSIWWPPSNTHSSLSLGPHCAAPSRRLLKVFLKVIIECPGLATGPADVVAQPDNRGRAQHRT